MKKLVRISHIRCGEEIWGGYTYLWAPEDITIEQLNKDIKIARNNI